MDAVEAKAAGLQTLQRTLPYVEAIAADNAHRNEKANVQGAFLVGSQRSAADVLLAQALYEAAEACLGGGGDLAWLQKDCPHIFTVVSDVLVQPNMVAYLCSELRYPPSDAAYVKQVDTVLGRI